MNDNWVTNEFNQVDIGDERLKKRLTKLAGMLAKSPESTISQASNGSVADTKAAYRFFQNNNVSSKKIIDSHSHSTNHRCQDFQNPRDRKH